MNDLKFHQEAFECRPNQIDFTISVSVLDREGNCVQVVPLTCQGVCFPYDIKAAVEEVVQQVNGRIAREGGQRPKALAPGV